MKHMVVPPPMSAFAVELPSPASCVCFSPPPCCGDIAVLLSNGRIAIFQSVAENGVKEEFKPPGKPPKLIGNYRYNKLEYYFLEEPCITVHIASLVTIITTMSLPFLL